MPHKRPNSPYWQLQVRHLNAVPFTLRKSSGVRSKAVARQMEHVIRRIDEMALLEPRYCVLLVAVQEGKITPSQLLLASQQHTLDALIRDIDSPPLADALDVFERTLKDDGCRVGLTHIRKLMPAGASVTWLTEAKTITNVCLAVERGETTGKPIKRNSVRRQVLRAISLFLRYQFGNAERNRVMADVQFRAVDDRRTVNLSPTEIARLLSSASSIAQRMSVPFDEYATIIKMAILTSADRGVLLAGPTSKRTYRGLRVRDVEIHVDASGQHFGQVFYDDRKAKGRRRTIGLGAALSGALVPLCQGKTPDETVFAMRYQDWDHVWRRIRGDAHLEHLRFKDLRHLFFILGEQAGIPLAIRSRGGGHSDIRRSADYSDFSAVFNHDHANTLESALGLAG